MVVPKQAKGSKPRVIYWFRTDLRLHDSPALKAALDLKPQVLFPIWTWDPHYVYRARVGPNRWQFLTDCQRDLSSALTKLNDRQKLHVIREAPQTVFPKLFKLWEITHLVFEKDTDAYARDRDEAVMKLAEDAGVHVTVKVGRTLYDPDELVKYNGGKPTMSMTQTQTAAKKLGDPPKPIPAPSSLPDPGNTDLSSIDHDKPDPRPDLNAAHRSSEKSERQYASIMGPGKDFAVPSLEEMGIETATTPHRGGESIALKMLDEICRDEDYTGTFEKPKSAPTAFQPASTTLLSPHHHFGSLSIREFWWRVEEIYQSRKRNKKPNSSIPENLHGQLLFREMYFGAQAALGYAFAQEAGNKICKLVDWHLRSTPPGTSSEAEDGHGPLSASGDYLIDNAEAETWFHRWRSGTTGFPWIDALMRQLRQEGWIHHLGRHAVACFLTRGGCYVHWERGASVFEEWLLDHETACNAGNWMWLSCTAFYTQFIRCYSPIAFPKKTDPNGDFVRHYIPELSRFDRKFIYEPWKASAADQKKWGCLIRGDGDEIGQKTTTYPTPMLDFDTQRTSCIAAIKHAYAVNLHGDDPRVAKGTWRDLFELAPSSPAEPSTSTTSASQNGRLRAGQKRSRSRAEKEEEGDEDKRRAKRTSPSSQRQPKAQQGRGRSRGRGRPRNQNTLDAHLSNKNA